MKTKIKLEAWMKLRGSELNPETKTLLPHPHPLLILQLSVTTILLLPIRSSMDLLVIERVQSVLDLSWSIPLLLEVSGPSEMKAGEDQALQPTLQTLRLWGNDRCLQPEWWELINHPLLAMPLLQLLLPLSLRVSRITVEEPNPLLSLLVLLSIPILTQTLLNNRQLLDCRYLEATEIQGRTTDQLEVQATTLPFILQIQPQSVHLPLPIPSKNPIPLLLNLNQSLLKSSPLQLRRSPIHLQLHLSNPILQRSQLLNHRFERGCLEVGRRRDWKNLPLSKSIQVRISSLNLGPL